MENGMRRRLSDIFTGENMEALARQFDATEAAPDYAPLPANKYAVDFVQGQLCTSQSGNTGYTCTFEVNAGEFSGRRLWHTFWLTEAAMPYSKRDLNKLGIETGEQFEKPVPPGIFCSIKVVVRTDDDGTQRNKVIAIEPGGVRNDPTVDPDFGRPSPSASGKGGAG
jgi:hypothetical protein